MAIKVSTTIKKATYPEAVVSIKAFQQVHFEDKFMTTYAYTVYADDTLDTIVDSGICNMMTELPDSSFSTCYSYLKKSFPNYVDC